MSIFKSPKDRVNLFCKPMHFFFNVYRDYYNFWSVTKHNFMSIWPKKFINGTQFSSITSFSLWLILLKGLPWYFPCWFSNNKVAKWAVIFHKKYFQQQGTLLWRIVPLFCSKVRLALLPLLRSTLVSITCASYKQQETCFSIFIHPMQSLFFMTV